MTMTRRRDHYLEDLDAARCPYCHSQLCPDRAIGDDCRVDCGREPHDIDECAQRIHGAVCGCATGVDNHTRLLTVLRVPPGRGVQLRLAVKASYSQDLLSDMEEIARELLGVWDPPPVTELDVFDCDTVLRQQLVFQMGAKTAFRINQVIDRVQEQNVDSCPPEI